MKLLSLIEGINFEVIKGNPEVNIINICHDSRLVEDGSLFIAIEGFESDGHAYINKAVVQGAAAIIVTKEGDYEAFELPIIRVEDGRIALACAATRFYNRPTSQFGLVGVTGTNGKTSTVFLIDRILQGANKKTGVIGTIENRIGDEIIPATHTTPDALELQRLFSRMVEANVNDVVMEVSSHALDLSRVHGAEFDVAVFTNLTLDHLDYHKTMEAYRDAKLRLFMMAPKAVINMDDETGRYFLEKTIAKEVYTYSAESSQAVLYAKDILINIEGTKFNLVYQDQEYPIVINTPGRFSVYNALAAIGASLALGVPMAVIARVLAANSVVRGRFETIASPKGYYAVVDYAHAPDGLLNVLKTIEEFVEGRIITVFGCGGDRDRTKRPIMGKIAGEHSNYCIITSDNPRTEEPEAIIDEVEVGTKESGCEYSRITDRKTAIIHALSMAKPGDLVLVAGKGHEDYQIIGKTKIHFDDREIIMDFMRTQA